MNFSESLNNYISKHRNSVVSRVIFNRSDETELNTCIDKLDIKQDNNNISGIVIDNGSYLFRAGYSGEQLPQSTIPSILGLNKEATFIGDELISAKDIFEYRYPIQNGIVQHWDVIEKVWNFIFEKKLKVNSSEFPVLMTESPLNPKNKREKMTEILFETFNVPSFYLANQALLSLYASNRTTGIVLNSGDGETFAVPVYENKIITDSIIRLDIGGYDLSNHIHKSLSKNHSNMDLLEERNMIDEIKQSECKVPVGLALRFLKNKTFIKNGKPVLIEKEKCAEALFRPIVIFKDIPGIHEITFNSIMKCDKEIQNDLFSNIVLSGSSTMFKHFEERFHHEIKHLAPEHTKINIIAPADRSNSAWIGGSILSCLPEYESMLITKQEYKENGASIINQKCA